MQQLLQPPVAGRIMRRVYRLVVLAEELAAFLLRQVPQNGLGIIRILCLSRRGGHETKLHPGPGRGSATTIRFTRASYLPGETCAAPRVRAARHE